MNQYAEAVINKEPEKAKILKAKIENHNLHFAIDNGLGSTIREDALHINAYKENEMFKTISPLFKDREAYQLLKNWWALPDSKMGAYFGEWFDKTEVIPKLALYLNLTKSGLPKEEAMQRVLMAFPNYSMNLHPALAFMDILSPYTKFATQYPKIMYMALRNQPVKLAQVLLMANTIHSLSWAYMDDDNKRTKREQWFESHNFTRISSGYTWYTGSMNIFNFPYSDGRFNFDMVFGQSAWQKMLFPFDLNPITPVKKE